ncbi:MAG: aminotransferase class IV [Bacteroidia bacterium]|nr:aminotransferase class IV [Bacteroidia bacterium]
MNRFNLYGDLLFESIKIIGTKPQHLTRHFSRLMKGAALLNFETDSFDFDIFEKEIINSIKKYFRLKSNNSNIARLRFVLYRNANGFYLPDSNKVNFYTEIFSFEPSLSIEPVSVGIYAEQAKAPGPLAGIKSGNALIYVLASIRAKENKLDDMLILNTNGNIIESTSSNIFWFSNGKWFTPPLKDGCVAGIMREIFMEENVVTEKSCSLNDLINADKRQLSNAIQGIRDFVIIT